MSAPRGRVSFSALTGYLQDIRQPKQAWARDDPEGYQGDASPASLAL